MQKASEERLVIIDYPVCLVCLAGVLSIMVLYAQFSGNVQSLYGMVLLLGMTSLLILGAKKRKYMFDKNAKDMKWEERNAFVSRSGAADFHEIGEVKLSKGKGRYTHTGQILIKLSGKWVTIVGQDICFGRLRRLEQVRSTISTYLL